MDWLRRLFGYERPTLDGNNPFQSPTWDDIIRNRDSQQHYEDSWQGQHHHPWGHFPQDRFQSDMFEDPRFFFGQVGDVFAQFDEMMRELHRSPVWAFPEAHTQPEPQSPRDYMLKVPDSSHSPPGTGAPLHPHPGRESEDRDSDGDTRDYMDNFTFTPPHNFFDGIFQHFGVHPGESPFAAHLPDAAQDPDNHSRDSMIKKDSDIDDRVGDLSRLPEGRPGYTAPYSRQSPGQHTEQPSLVQPGVHSKFYSQSIVTIRRPDGSIEETKKYTDSTGREEVTVTHKQPDDSSSSLTPSPHLPDGGVFPQGPSLFSWLFRR